MAAQGERDEAASPSQGQERDELVCEVLAHGHARLEPPLGLSSYLLANFFGAHSLLTEGREHLGVPGHSCFDEDDVARPIAGRELLAGQVATLQVENIADLA